MHRITAVLIAVVLVGSSVLAGVALAGGDGSTAAPVPRSSVCFPADRWDGDDAERPCARISRVWEDGSVQIHVAQADDQGGYVTNTGARR